MLSPRGCRVLLLGFLLVGGLALVSMHAPTASAGLLDRSFSGDGKVRTEFGSTEDLANDVAVQRDGKTIAVGVAAPRRESADVFGDLVFAIARYTRSGRLDPTFSGNGKLSLNFHPDPRGQTDDYEEAMAVAVQPDGRGVVAGQVRSGGEGSVGHIAVVRLTGRGRLDHSFSGDGKTVLHPTCGDEPCLGGRPYDVVIQPNGRILLAGCFWCGHYAEFTVLRLRPGGGLDRSFGDGGEVITDLTEFGDVAVALALRGDRKIVALSTEFDVVRYHLDGRLDRSFGDRGLSVRDMGYAAGSSGLALQRDGRIVLAGQVHDPDGYPTGDLTGPLNVALVRLRPGGGMDTTFGGDGRVVTDIGGGPRCEEDRATDVVVQPTGRILAAGTACSPWPDFALVRYRANGRLDRSFGGDGRITTDLDGAEWGKTMALRFGKVVVAGTGVHRYDDYDFVLARYRVD
jgi:uncharacterized delta-60 repeat protein